MNPGIIDETQHRAAIDHALDRASPQHDDTRDDSPQIRLDQLWHVRNPEPELAAVPRTPTAAENTARRLHLADPRNALRITRCYTIRFDGSAEDVHAFVRSRDPAIAVTPHARRVLGCRWHGSAIVYHRHVWYQSNAVRLQNAEIHVASHVDALARDIEALLARFRLRAARDAHLRYRVELPVPAGAFA